MKSKTKTVISLNNISKIYEGPPPVKAVDEISLDIKEGDLVSIVGESGSGKSTLLNMIGLLDSTTEGNIEIEGQDTSTLSDDELSKFRGEKIGFIFQSFFLLPGLTAQENVAEGLLYQGIKREERLEKAAKVLKEVGLGDRLTHLPQELSGGQQQRVAAARAMASKPEVIFADEPSGNLDSKASKELLVFMKSIVEDLNQTIVMVTHDPYAASYAQRVIMLKDGEIANDLDNPSQEEIVSQVTSLTEI